MHGKGIGLQNRRLGVQVPRAVPDPHDPPPHDPGHHGPDHHRPARTDEGDTVSDRHETATKEQRTSPLTFYRQVVAELRKVVWPTRPQVVNYFFVVLVFVLTLAIVN